MIWGIFILSIMPATASVPAGEQASRAQQYAVYRAHAILPASLKGLVKRHGKYLFEGLDRGLKVPMKDINEARILAETRKITALVNKQANFKVVVAQMGYVSGLLATYSDPSYGNRTKVRQGFHFYLNKKLKRFLFVFDGYSNGLEQVGDLKPVISELRTTRKQFGELLEKQYRQVSYKSTYVFDERSGVFGVCSIYFSNLARTSAHLWYHAWKEANGDLTKTPFVKKEQSH